MNFSRADSDAHLGLVVCFCPSPPSLGGGPKLIRGSSKSLDGHLLGVLCEGYKLGCVCSYMPGREDGG